MVHLVEAATADSDLIHQFQENWKEHILTASVQAHMNISNISKKIVISSYSSRKQLDWINATWRVEYNAVCLLNILSIFFLWSKCFE